MHVAREAHIKRLAKLDALLETASKLITAAKGQLEYDRTFLENFRLASNDFRISRSLNLS